MSSTPVAACSLSRREGSSETLAKNDFREAIDTEVELYRGPSSQSRGRHGVAAPQLKPSMRRDHAASLRQIT
jgi:hypothetical protein